MRAVSDAGPLIHLSWIGRLDLLQELFDEVIAPAAVRDEVLRVGPEITGAALLREALADGRPAVRAVHDHAAVEALRAELDQGEAEALVLMGEADADIVLLDDRRARDRAIDQGLPVTGTLGLLRMARDRGLLPAVLPLLLELRQRGFRISADLVEQIRQEEVDREEA